MALRLWLTLWQTERSTLRVRADNYTVLAMASRMQASSDQLCLTVADMAPVLTDSCYMPWVAEHTPGIQNVVADTIVQTCSCAYHDTLLQMCVFREQIANQ